MISSSRVNDPAGLASKGENTMIIRDISPKSTVNILLFMMLVFFPVASTCWGTVYYVGSTSSANDSNTGMEEDKPWRTISKAANEANAGDIVYVKNGVYYETSEVRVKNSGRKGFPIAFQAYPNHFPVIDGSKSTVSKLIHIRGKDYITLGGFEIRNAYKYAVWVDGSNNIIRDCKIHNNGRDGGHRNGVTLKAEVGGGSHNTITRNEVYSNAWNGLSVESCNYTTISYNMFYDNGHQGVNIFPSTSTFTGIEDGNNITLNRISHNRESGIYTRYQRNNEISNNLVYGNGQWGIFFAGGGSGNPGKGNVYQANTKVYNNTIVNNNYDGLYIHTGSHVIVKNNLFYQNNHAPAWPEGDGKANLRMGNINGCVIDHNFYIAYPNTTGPFYFNKNMALAEWQARGFDIDGIFERTASFTDLKNDVYTLSSDSDAIDKGVDLLSEGIKQDINGVSRPQGLGFDIGACEFSRDRALSPPRNLRVRQ